MNSNLAYQYDIFEEKINGQVILMSPRPAIKHNLVADNISTIFNSYLKGKRCTPFGDGTELHLTEKDHFVPDGMIVCDSSKIHETCVCGAPDLVVEVLSPSTARRDRGYKMSVYEACGVREYWIVSVYEKTVEQYLLENGKFVLHNIHALYPPYIEEQLNDEERAEYTTVFQCSLFDDLEIHLEDIFDRV